MSDIDSFRKSIAGDVVTPSDADYETAIKRWALNATRRAAVVVFVKSTDDIAKTLQYARAMRLPLAIRGGGHNPAGASSVEGGIVIDLSRYFAGARVDSEKKVAYVQGGAIWGTVDSAAAEHGLAAVGGTVNSTGVGGLTTGGGFGFLTGEHGLVVDNLVQATVVIADGSVVTTSPTEHADLFYGIRGGGSNFGIVTEFVYRLHDQKNTVFGGMVIFNPDKLEALAKEFEEWWPHAGPKECVACVFGRAPDYSPAIVLVTFYNGSKAEGEKITKRFTDIGPIADLRHDMPYKDMNTLMNAIAVEGRCCWMRGVLMNDVPRMFTREAFDAVIAASESREFEAALIFEFLPQGKVNSVPATETPYCRRLPGNVLAMIQWDKDTPENAAKGLEIADKLTAHVKVAGQAYGNYSPDAGVLPTVEGPAKRNRAKELFRDHYPKMQEIKRKYDPDVIFNRWFAIEPVKA